MSNALGSTPAGVTQLPSASNRASLTLRDVAELYFAAYQGRDASRRLYLQQWCEQLGDRRLAEIDADLVADTLTHFGREPARVVARANSAARKSTRCPCLKQSGSTDFFIARKCRGMSTRPVRNWRAVQPGRVKLPLRSGAPWYIAW